MRSWLDVPFWGTLGSLLGVVVAGCAQDSRVVTPLPSPYHLDYREPPPMAPSPPPPSEPTTPEKPMPQAEREAVKSKWMPEHPLSNRWRHIVLHHSDSECGSLRDIDQWHFEQGWEHGCGYHFVVGNGTTSGDGQIEVSRRWQRQIHGAHTRLAESFACRKGVHFQTYNDHGIGIVLVGNFDKQSPTPRQMEVLVELVSDLMELCDIPPERVCSHSEVDQTRCPGRHFSIQALRRRLARSDRGPAGEVWLGVDR